MSRKQSARWQHLSQLKASALSFLQKKLAVWNTTTYSWDWLHHLVDDGALLAPVRYLNELKLTYTTQWATVRAIPGAMREAPA